MIIGIPLFIAWLVVLAVVTAIAHAHAN